MGCLQGEPQEQGLKRNAFRLLRLALAVRASFGTAFQRASDQPEHLGIVKMGRHSLLWQFGRCV